VLFSAMCGICSALTIFYLIIVTIIHEFQAFCLLKVYIHVTIYHVYQLAVVIFTKGQFYFQGESDDCINRLAKKDGLLAKYVSQCESLMLPILGFCGHSFLMLRLLLGRRTLYMLAVLPMYWRYMLPPFSW
jgi:hypothetical protein